VKIKRLKKLVQKRINGKTSTKHFSGDVMFDQISALIEVIAPLLLDPNEKKNVNKEGAENDNHYI